MYARLFEIFPAPPCRLVAYPTCTLCEEQIRESSDRDVAWFRIFFLSLMTQAHAERTRLRAISLKATGAASLPHFYIPLAGGPQASVYFYWTEINRTRMRQLFCGFYDSGAVGNMNHASLFCLYYCGVTVTTTFESYFLDMACRE